MLGVSVPFAQEVSAGVSGLWVPGSFAWFLLALAVSWESFTNAIG